MTVARRAALAAVAAGPAEEREERIRVVERESSLVQMKLIFSFSLLGPMSLSWT